MDSSFNLNREPLLNDILLIKNEFINNKNSQNNFLNKNQKEIIQNLILMGFNIEMIDMCFCFFEINSIEQAVQLMSKENEIWQHDYVKSENNLCIVCNEYSDHKNYITDKEKKLTRLKELNDSFNSKFRSSIEYLRQSNANRKSNNSNNSDMNKSDGNDIKNSNLFEININISNDNRNTIQNFNFNNNLKINGENKILFNNNSKKNNKYIIDSQNNLDGLILDKNNKSYSMEFDDSSIEENIFIRQVNQKANKISPFNVKVLDVGEAQNKIKDFNDENEDTNLIFGKI